MPGRTPRSGGVEESGPCLRHGSSCCSAEAAVRSLARGQLAHLRSHGVGNDSGGRRRLRPPPTTMAHAPSAATAATLRRGAQDATTTASDWRTETIERKRPWPTSGRCSPVGYMIVPGAFGAWFPYRRDFKIHIALSHVRLMVVLLLLSPPACLRHPKPSCALSSSFSCGHQGWPMLLHLATPHASVILLLGFEFNDVEDPTSARTVTCARSVTAKRHCCRRPAGWQ